MKVIAINGSPRPKGNTFNLIKYVFEELENAGIETEIVQLAGKKIRGCLSCYKCFANKDKHCSVDDDLNGIIDKMVEADGILLGSPTYVASVSSEIKALIDRACLVSTANGYLFKYKVGASVVAVRRAGSVSAFDTLNHFLLYNQMVISASSYWNMGFGLNPGEVEKDEEGRTIMKNLGLNMAWVLKKINA
ncbi:MAG: flavodoxin family protein [Deltaproteobacteria bacterium]|nr:flavodoxin family protein [Deltaproteobacteria bacterium]MBW2052264.1 flavodoxin family protein [Deltaproteobacteria bacterium]MBW2140830.1 flavodoxin family protein [Deltaproteobacteria bacterium]MBW2323641.1 flavodoxin family protein [Deltaproteobacteria bacterium]